jgi:hypothetical protein
VPAVSSPQDFSPAVPLSPLPAVTLPPIVPPVSRISSFSDETEEFSPSATLIFIFKLVSEGFLSIEESALAMIN